MLKDFDFVRLAPLYVYSKLKIKLTAKLPLKIVVLGQNKFDHDLKSTIHKKLTLNLSHLNRF